MGPFKRIKARARRLVGSKTRNRSSSNQPKPRGPSPPSPSRLSNHASNAITALDVAESAAKAIPVVGGLVEGMLGASRKILTVAKSVQVYEEDARELATRARRAAESIRSQLHLGGIGPLGKSLSQVLRVLEDIANATIDLANANPQYILRNREIIRSQISSYSSDYVEALQDLNIYLHFNHNSYLSELCQRLQDMQDDTRNQLISLNVMIDDHHLETQAVLDEVRERQNYLQDDLRNRLVPVNAKIDDLRHTMALNMTAQVVVLFGKATTYPSK